MAEQNPWAEEEELGEGLDQQQQELAGGRQGWLALGGQALGPGSCQPGNERLQLLFQAAVCKQLCMPAAAAPACTVLPTPSTSVHVPACLPATPQASSRSRFWSRRFHIRPECSWPSNVNNFCLPATPQASSRSRFLSRGPARRRRRRSSSASQHATSPSTRRRACWARERCRCGSAAEGRQPLGCRLDGCLGCACAAGAHVSHDFWSCTGGWLVAAMHT